MSKKKKKTKVVKKKKETMFDRIAQNFNDQNILLADGLNEAVIGIDELSMRLIYSKKKCIKIFMDEGLTEEDALEHFSYNVQGSYVGEQTPIWCDDTI